MKLDMRAIRLGGGVVGQAFVDNATEATAFALKYGRDAEIYMGVAPRIGNKEYGSPRVLWVDIDFKDTPEALARTELMLIDPAPSVIINSGGGLHVYWILDGEVSDSRVVPILRWLVRSVGGDMTGAEVARILRLPGTMNHKYKPPRQVTIEEMWPNRIYEEWEFGWDDGSGVGGTINGNGNGSRQKSAYTGPTGGAAALSAARAQMHDREPAIEGHGGDKWTFDTACMLISDYGIGEHDALELMMEWNAGCVPPWSEGELRKKIQNAMRYSRGEVGANDPERDFAGVAVDILDDPDDIEDGGSEHSRMNVLTKRYRACIDGGRLRVYFMEDDAILGRSYWQCSSKRDFTEIVACIEHMGKIECGENKKTHEPRMEDIATHWLQCWHKKETYRGLVYMPECPDEKTPDGRLNIWRGFSPETKRPATTWEPLKQVILKSICGGNTAWRDYIMGWLAFAVQRPHVPAMVALVLRGPKGTGKSSLGKYFVRLFGRHGMPLTSQERLTGRFNMHLRDVSALFADEAFWAGSKEGEGALKGLITEKTITYEGKGQNAEAGRNCVHVMMASNESWVVPAGIDQERRFAVFDVAEDNRPRSFWNNLHEEMENGGGLAAMLNELMAYDISRFEIRDIPKTGALAEQKLLTLNPAEQWLVNLVMKSYEDASITLHNSNWVTMDDMEASIQYFYDKKRVPYYQTRTHIGILISKLMPAAKKIRFASDENGQRKWGYELPSIDVAQTHLEKSLGLDFSMWVKVSQEVDKSDSSLEEFF